MPENNRARLSGGRSRRAAGAVRQSADTSGLPTLLAKGGLKIQSRAAVAMQLDVGRIGRLFGHPLGEHAGQSAGTRRHGKPRGLGLAKAAAG